MQYDTKRTRREVRIVMMLVIKNNFPVKGRRGGKWREKYSLRWMIKRRKERIK
jgi:hypothetical protein